MTQTQIKAYADTPQEAAEAQRRFNALMDEITPEDVDAECREGQEFFTLLPDDGSDPLFIDVEKAHRLVREGHPAFIRKDLPLSTGIVEAVLRDCGVEKWAVEQLPDDFEWEKPALAIVWRADEKAISLTVFDGAHRIVKAALRGDESVPTAITPIEWVREELLFEFKNPKIGEFFTLITKHNVEWRTAMEFTNGKAGK